MPKKKNDSDEMLIYGRRAVMAAWQCRPEAIVRAYATKERINWVGDILKWCAKHKKAYHIVNEEELAKITHSVHHEGLALLVKVKPSYTEESFLRKVSSLPNSSLLFLDGVSNPHNIGAITRSMAHFGSYFLLGDQAELPNLSSAWARISEGGSEWVDIVRIKDKLSTLEKLKEMGFSVIALSSHGKETIYESQMPKKSAFLLGHEIHGLSQAMQKIADKIVSIPGTGNISSLNVSVTAAICLSEWYRRNAPAGLQG